MKNHDELIRRISESLPQKPGILGEGKLFKSVILIPLIKIEDEYHLLFQKRNEAIRQGGELCFPGGGQDKEDKNEKETAIRETIEELGISRDKIEILGKTDTFVAVMGALVRGFVGLLHIESLDELKPNPDEVEKLFTIPLKELMTYEFKEYQIMVEVKPSFTDEEGKEHVLLPARELGLPGRYHGSWGFKNYSVFVHQTEHGPLWGITARFVLDFIDRIKENLKDI